MSSSLFESREELRQLNEKERGLMTRMLSDPQLFPLPFKTWLINWLESSDMILPISSVAGLSDRLTVLRAVERTAVRRRENGALILSDLPTADPHVRGQLWNHLGTLKISAG